MEKIDRCTWPRTALDTFYHDTEWGVPVEEDARLFEHFSLAAAQAGLSWLTVLKRRAAYKVAFADFDPQKVALYGEVERTALLSNTGIIRNQQKIKAVIHNARIIMEIQARHGSLSRYLWQFTDGKPIINYWEANTDIPATTSLSDLVSKELKKAGFAFAGSTICYAVLQSVGVINDHLISCYRHGELCAYTQGRAFGGL